MTKDHFLMRAKDWALLVSIITVVTFGWAVFTMVLHAQERIVLAQSKLDTHETRLDDLEPAVEQLKQISAVQEAHFQDMIARLDRIEKQTK